MPIHQLIVLNALIINIDYIRKSSLRLNHFIANIIENNVNIRKIWGIIPLLSFVIESQPK